MVFWNGRSCSTQIIHCLDMWNDILDEGSVAVVYLDFVEAFDSVP